MRHTIFPCATGFFVLCLAIYGAHGESGAKDAQAPTALSSSASSVFSSSVSSSVIIPLAAPPGIELDVPFTSQAPFDDWNDPYQNACEEAAILMVHAYWANEELNPTAVDTTLRSMTTWVAEQKYGESVNMEQLASIAEALYPNLRARIVEPVTPDMIKWYLAHGRPVLVPTAGRLLGNPYFRGEGPWYHMLVITGYANGFFTTNDSGTSRGESFLYREEVVMNAIHDWVGADERITEGPKRMLIVEPR